MGIGIGHNWSCNSYDKPKVIERIVETPLPNPNPKRFTILNHHVNGKFLLILVNYPDCTNYEGNKILLYENTLMEDLVGRGSVDPHFSNNSDVCSLIARFVPTIKGWDMAIKLISSLQKI